MTIDRSAGLARSGLLVAGILLIGANLRAPIIGVAPVLEEIRASLSLGAAAAGTLTTLPLLAFAIISPFCVLPARRYGLERSLFAALVLIGGGIVLRSAGANWSLFTGTGLIGIGIAVANVLLPSLMKRDFPDRIPTLTSMYALASGVASALASVLAVPLAGLPGSNWQWALGAPVLVTLAAMAAWVPQLSARTPPASDTETPPHSGPIWRSAVAWQVTAFFGLNALVFYVVVGWLPAMLTAEGFSPVAAGSIDGVLQLSSAAAGLFVGPIVGRLRDQKAVTACAASMQALALAGLLIRPEWAIIWATLFGLGTGAGFILGLSFVSLRAADARQTAALSSMVQTVGYTVAAAAPPLAGMLHDSTGGWRLALAIGASLCAVMASIGWRAGRAVHI